MNQTFYGCASITTSQRTDLVKKQQMPGPGAHDPVLHDNLSIPLWTLKPKIQYTSCFHNKNLYVPAPGSYQVSSSFKDQSKNKLNGSKLQKFKQRSFVQKSSPVIALQIPSFVDQKTGFSFGYRDQIKVLQRSPGPIYHIGQKDDEARKQKLFNSSLGFGFGDRNKIQRNNVPGPGNYCPSPQKMCATSEKWTFSKSSRKDKPQYQNPTGPGQYNAQKYDTSRSFKLKGRYNQRQTQCYDTSPCSYTLPDTKTKQGTIFKKSLNSLNEKNQNQKGPSPFSYNPLSSALKSGGYTLGKKICVQDQNIQNPGPGSYQILNKFAKNGGYICRKQREKKKMLQTSDNFGKYSPNNQITSFKSPKYSFKQSNNKNQAKYSNIGPGSYQNLRQSPKTEYSLGKDVRFKPLKKQKYYGNIILQQKIPCSVGYLPPYLRNKKAKDSLRQNNSNKQNLCEYQQTQK